MYVVPHSAPSSALIDGDEPAPAASTASAAAAALTTPPITAGLLTQVNNMYSTLHQLKCDPMDALTILFDYLNTGSHDGYIAALRAAGDRNKRAPVSSGLAGGLAGSAAPARQLPFQATAVGVAQGLWPHRSWPEKVMTCKDGGAHVKLKLGMQDSSFKEFEGAVNRGHRQLPPGCLDFIPTPRRGSADEGKQWFTHFMAPALRDLKPNQAILVAPPNAHVMLIGMNAEGRQFGLAPGRGGARTEHILSGHELEEALHVMRFMSSQASASWAMVTPR